MSNWAVEKRNEVRMVSGFGEGLDRYEDMRAESLGECPFDIAGNDGALCDGESRLDIYLDIINLFLQLLRILGSKNDD